MRRWAAVAGAGAAALALSGCAVLPHLAPPNARPPAPAPRATTVDPAIPNNTACLEYWATTDRWYDDMDLEQYSLDLRAIVPDADEFMAGQLTNFADALDGIEKDLPIGQVESIADMQLTRICDEAGVPEPVSDIVFTY